MTKAICWLMFGVLIGTAAARRAAAEEVPVRSNANQVFQFMQSGTCTAWPDGQPSKATAYLWIPEKCQRVRGLLILCANVPEHMLVGHPAIRAACEANDLAIVWSVPSFMNFRKDMPKEHKVVVAFLQELLDGLAKTSGYEEIATAPWLPIGESGHLLMVDALVEAKPERCMAGVWLKNNHFPPANRSVPALVVFGTAQEWSQDKGDIRAKWNDVEKVYDGVLDRRRKNPEWPLSYVIDGHSGHFDCSERITRYVARYVDQVAKARLPGDGSATLKPVSLDGGFVAGLAVRREAKAVTAYGAADASARAQPWYFDRDGAAEAQAIAAINWDAQTQVPAHLDDAGQPRPFDFNGIANIKAVKWEPDGVTFGAAARLLDKIPATFAVGAGEALASTPGDVTVEWLCGQVAPAGPGKFRIALDRTYGSGATYLLARKDGTGAVRTSVQPCGVQISALRNGEGQKQTITFDLPVEVKAGTDSIPLEAKSDAGLPVEYFVVAGPAVVKDGRLVFTPVPPRAKYPVTVTVAAWQWGRATEPKVRTADVVRRELRLLPPATAGKP